jgi:hypothetical protein
VCVVQRLWFLLLLVLYAAVPALGGLPESACSLARFPFFLYPLLPMYAMFRAWVESPVGVRAWWARAALTLAPEMAAQLACSEAGQGGVVRFTAQAWGTFTRDPNFAAFFALRLAALLAFDTALWWRSERARNGEARLAARSDEKSNKLKGA